MSLQNCGIDSKKQECDTREVVVLREKRTRNNPTFVQERSRYRRGRLMLWTRIRISSRSDMHIIRNGNWTAQKYTEVILRPHIVPYAETFGLEISRRQDWYSVLQSLIDNLIVSMVNSCLRVTRGRHRVSFNEVFELDRGRITAFRDFGFSFREIGQHVGRNQAIVMGICHRWVQEETTDRRGQLHSPRCTTAHEDKRIVCIAVMDRAATSRTMVQQILSVSHHSVPARTIRRHLQQNVRKVPIASFTLDWKPLAFTSPMEQ
ncbi:uncharacterized protein TNCV_655931 [Trichonephila clavipes]|nr:uncharacterized protein TNCV_655931 [Trichonephila clavipes]